MFTLYSLLSFLCMLLTLYQSYGHKKMNLILNENWCTIAKNESNWKMRKYLAQMNTKANKIDRKSHCRQ